MDINSLALLDFGSTCSNPKMVPRSDREDQASRLALRCREDAAKTGIASQDLEAAAEGNLIGNMLQALDAAEFRQMYRDQMADQEE